MGPLFAQDTASAIAAIIQARKVLPGTALTIDVMNYQADFYRTLQENNARFCRDFQRMSLPPAPDEFMQQENMFAATGPEYG